VFAFQLFDLNYAVSVLAAPVHTGEINTQHQTHTAVGRCLSADSLAKLAWCVADEFSAPWEVTAPQCSTEMVVAQRELCW